MTRHLTACIALLTVAASLAPAAPLNLDKSFPDIFAANLQGTYDADTDTLSITTVTGGVFAFREATAAETASTFLGSLTITVQIDDTGAIVDSPSNTLSIANPVNLTNNHGVPTGTLLSGNVVDFGFSTTGGGDIGTMEFVTELDTLTSVQPNFFADFDINGPATLLSGTIMTVSGDNFTDWTSDWTISSTSSVADTFIVPEPATAVLMGLAGLALLRRRMR